MPECEHDDTFNNEVLHSTCRIPSLEGLRIPLMNDSQVSAWSELVKSKFAKNQRVSFPQIFPTSADAFFTFENLRGSKDFAFENTEPLN